MTSPIWGTHLKNFQYEQLLLCTGSDDLTWQIKFFHSSLIDMDKVKQVAEVLSGTHDFSAFTSHTRLEKQPWLNPVKTMDVQVERSKPFMHSHQMCDEVDDWEFVFHGNSFLYKQVSWLQCAGQLTHWPLGDLKKNYLSILKLIFVIDGWGISGGEVALNINITGPYLQ